MDCTCTPPCRRGEMVAGKAESCPTHPEVRLRTRDQISAFAKAFDARVTGSTPQ